MSEIIKEGTVNRIVYYSDDTNYTVFEIIDEEDNSDLTCVGHIPKLLSGEYVKLSGNFSYHSIYGEQFSVTAYDKTTPSSTYGIEKYLSSGIIPGIGDAMAKRIVKKFGLKTLEIIEKEPDTLADIRGITLKKARQINKIFIDEIVTRDIMIFLQGFDISAVYSMKIYKRFKKDTIEIIKKNPYILADEIEGISFKIADSIAMKMGIESSSPFRLKSAIKFSLMQGIQNGNTYLPREQLYNEVASIVPINNEIFLDLLKEMQMDNIIIQKLINENCVYLNIYFYSENYIAKKLNDLVINKVEKDNKLLKEIKNFEKNNDITLAKEQKEAVLESLCQSILVITGGPGTGKTTTIRAIINILENRGYEVILAAPTGRAAKRMEETTGMEAKTIHRLLEINFSKNETHQNFERNEDNPLEADVIILDESSMIDNMLMYSFLKAVSMGTRVILVGDKDQLPSIGAGNVLKDIISSNVIKVVRLDEIFRQVKTSQITTNAHKINHGEYPDLNIENSDFYFVERNNIDMVQKELVNLVVNRLPKFKKFNSPQNIQVLTPMRKSPLGVNNLNSLLQAAINPPHKSRNEKEYRNITFREGDKVMQIKNNYNITWSEYNKETNTMKSGTGVYNGDEGTLEKIDENNELLIVKFDDRKVEYEFSQMEELELSYAITIHKSQGSEYPIVVIPVHSGPSMLLTRNLLYTAVTRGKELVVIIGNKDKLNFMVDNNKERNRYSNLDFFLKDMGRLTDENN
ncbi:MAG: ATP-dependent RecD-like DNA helicase [Lachnospirales bacterium]